MTAPPRLDPDQPSDGHTGPGGEGRAVSSAKRDGTSASSQPATSRAEKKLQTRSRLLDAAQKVFASRGFADASLDEIAEVAGLTKGAVYSNFDKKLDLLLAVLDERMNRRFMEITETVDMDRALSEQAAQGGQLFMDAFQEERDLYLLWLECSIHSVHDADVRNDLVKLDHMMRDAVAAFIEHHARTLGLTLPLPATQLATAITCLADGLALERLKDPTSIPDDLFGTMLMLLYRGLEQERPPSDA